MKKIVYTCDRCKSEIRENPIRFFMRSYGREDGIAISKSQTDKEMEELDFCKNCADFLTDLIKRKCKKGAPAVVNPEFEAAVEEMVATSQPEDNTPPK